MTKKKTGGSKYYKRVFTWQELQYIIDHAIVGDSEVAWQLGVPPSVVNAFRKRVQRVYAAAIAPSAEALKAISYRDRCVVCRVRRKCHALADGLKGLCDMCYELLDALKKSNEQSTSSRTADPPKTLGRDLTYRGDPDGFERNRAPGGSWNPDNR